MRIFGRDPALWIASIGAGLTLLIALGIPPGLNDIMAGAITATLTVGVTTWTALQVRPLSPTVFSGLVIAVGVLLATFNFNVPGEVIAAVTSFLSVAVALAVIRPQSTPLSDPAPGFLPTPDSARHLANGELRPPPRLRGSSTL